MSPELFDSLLNIVESSLVKLSARKPISPEHRLALTLRFLATGASFRHLAYSFRMDKSTNQGQASDGGLFDSSDLKRAMDNGQLNLPGARRVE